MEETGLQHQIWPKKKGSIFGPTICSLPGNGIQTNILLALVFDTEACNEVQRANI